MLRGYRGVIIAFAGLALSALGVSAQDNEKTGGGAERAQSEQRQTTPPPPPSNLAANQPQTYQPACEAPKNRDDATFCIERRAAVAAEQSDMIPTALMVCENGNHAN